MRIIIAALTLLLVAACGRNGAVPPPVDHDPIVMRIYSVPAERAREIRDSVHYLISAGASEGIVAGRATVLGSDRIAVAVRASMISGVEQLIEVAGETAAGEPERIRFQYWLVRAVPGESGEMPAALTTIGNVLKEVRDQIGPATFMAVDYAEHIVRSGAESEVSGRVLQGQVEAAARGDRIAADLQLFGKRDAGHVVTEIDLRNGETVVLALVGEREQKGLESSRPGFSAFVIRAETF